MGPQKASSGLLGVLGKETPHLHFYSFWLRTPFSNILKSAENNGLFKGFRVGNDKVNVSDLQFVDDTLILMEREEVKVPILKSIINCFELVLGFKVNWVKSQLSTIAFNESESSNMANLLGCSYKGWPVECLGLPLGGSPRIRHFCDLVVDRCRKRLSAWKANISPSGGE